MIISASRRTDIPSYYSEWFFKRIEEGFVDVRNPMNIHRISRISLDNSVVDGIVFWTKNPIPMLDKLDRLKKYTYYFQFTINPYGKDVEQNLPSKKNVIIPTFKKLSRLIGPEKVIWRYDPIFLASKYDIEWHIDSFKYIAKELSGYTEKCVISFLDLYRNTQNNTKDMGLLRLNANVMRKIAEYFSEIAYQYHIKLESCSESIDLMKFGIEHGHCIDRRLFERLLGCSLNVDKDKNQREECGCVASIDIGMYNTCKNHCKYCYANYNQNIVKKNYLAHDLNHSLISGNIMDGDIVKVRKFGSCKNCQLDMFN